MRAASNPVSAFPSVQGWKRNVAMLRHAGNHGKSAFVITKVWTSGTRDQKDRWHEFALASFLLGNVGRSYFDFSYSRQYNPTKGHPWWRIRLGDPLGPYDQRGEIFVRKFERGRVLVNPTDQLNTVRLHSMMRTLTGSLVSRVTLGPHTGRILRSV